MEGTSPTPCLTVLIRLSHNLRIKFRH